MTYDLAMMRRDSRRALAGHRARKSKKLRAKVKNKAVERSIIIAIGITPLLTQITS